MNKLIVSNIAITKHLMGDSIQIISLNFTESLGGRYLGNQPQKS